MHGVVALDASGEAIGPCLTLRDRRSIDEAREISERVGRGNVYALTGAHLDACAPVAKLLWLKRNWPSLYASASKFVLPKDYVRGRLVGKVVTDILDAAGTLLFDIDKRSWAMPLLEACEVPPEKLPIVLDPHCMAGTLQAQSARELDLEPGIPVVVGAGDDIEALGAGLVEPGMTMEHLGTTGSIVTCVGDAIRDPEMKLELYPWVEPALWLLGGSTSNAGGAIAWADGVFQGSEPTRSDCGLRLSRAALPQLEEPLVFLPYLSGERCPVWNPHARGVLFGLSLAHTHEDVIQSVFEGVAFSLRHLQEYIYEVGGRPGDVVCRDVTTDTLWTQLRADIYGRSLIILKGGDPTALGAMMLAGVGIGVFSDVREAVRETVVIARTIEHSPGNAEGYDELYGLYKALASDLQPLFQAPGHASTVEM